MKCSKCQFDNPDATNFCGKCRVPLPADARMADSLTKTLVTPLPVISKGSLIAGKYKIIDETGHGGMGIVYKAEDVKLQRCVALKFLPFHLMDSPELRELRVKIPTLMLNGKYDLMFPLGTSAKPLFDLLGTPEDQKKMVVYDNDHSIPRNECIKETLDWLDKYLGPVK